MIALTLARRELRGGVRGLRIGVARDWFTAEHPVSPATAAALVTAEDTFRRLGAEVNDIALPLLGEYGACGFIILVTDRKSVV